MSIRSTRNLTRPLNEIQCVDLGVKFESIHTKFESKD